jgi:hypothetical protein
MNNCASQRPAGKDKQSKSHDRRKRDALAAAPNRDRAAGD